MNDTVKKEDGLQKIALRNQFYQDGHRKAILAFLFSIITNIIMGSLLVYILTHPPAPIYFATSKDGRITPILPLNKPNMTDSAVKQWATEAALAAFSFNYVNYQQELQAASGFFTADGWKQFQNALQDSGTLDVVIQRKMIVSSRPTGAPRMPVPSQVLSNGRYAWQIQIPIQVVLRNQNTFNPLEYLVTMVIMRVSSLNTPSGIGIQQLLVEESGPGAAS